MSEFPLKEATLSPRGKEVRVRELSHGEHSQFLEKMAEDKRSGVYVVASLGTISPRLSAEEARTWPKDVIEEIVGKIMELSGMTAKGDPQKEPDAR